MLRKLFKRRKNDAPKEQLVITPIPALVTILLRKEKEKGAPLSEEEVLAIRDNAACIALPISEQAALEESRGYRDLDTDNVWQDWQVARRELMSDK
jgi:hypothetical protein